MKVDYYLLFTFVFFFIFTGNLGEIHIIREFLESSVKSKEFFVGFGVSQIISNVPATLILYQFVDDIKNLPQNLGNCENLDEIQIIYDENEISNNKRNIFSK